MARVLAVLGALVLVAACVGAILLLRPKPLPALDISGTTHAASATATPAAGSLPELKAGNYTGTRPALIDISADGGDVITKITWSNWTATKAVGTGTRTLQSCKPNCAQGTNTEVPETLVLSQPEGGFFTVIVATFPGQVAEYQEATFWPLGASQTMSG